MAVAMMLQVVFNLGIDIVAVRHIAARTQSLEALLPIIFSARLVLHGVITLLWVLLALATPLSLAETFAWIVGGAYFLILGMNFQWYYQATQRVPALSRIQTLTTFAVSACFLLFFRPGQAAGTDLLVMALAHGLVTLWVWYRVYRETGGAMFITSFGEPTYELLKEGQANWLFTIAYNALTLLGLLLIPRLLPDESGHIQAGYFHSINQLALALQVLLAHVSYIFYPKIVAWRRKQPTRFRLRVFGLALAAWTAGIISYFTLAAFGEPLFKIAYSNPEFHTSFKILPIMVLAKFVGTGSGFLTWGLLAEHKDWLAVQCCVIPVVIACALHFVYVPAYGFVAAGWLYALGELLLFLACAIALLRLKLSSPAQP
ncbi:MAG: hypothetical protein M2R46_03681 [Verrucomicrobia subdivision 3 bacterium]|nr:hypothetical protein [Limisphaerales bacterium]